MFDGLRQTLLFPREFRISAVPIPVIENKSADAWMEALRGALASSPSQNGAHSTDTEGGGREPDSPPASNQTVANLCLEIWRTERHLLPMLAQNESEPARKTKRSFQRLKDALEAARIEIDDHTGDRYETGMSVKVLAFEPRPELSCEMVTETVKPTIYLAGDIICHGEVIVGTPEQKVKV